MDAALLVVCLSGAEFRVKLLYSYSFHDLYNLDIVFRSSSLRTPVYCHWASMFHCRNNTFCACPFPHLTYAKISHSLQNAMWNANFPNLRGRPVSWLFLLHLFKQPAQIDSQLHLCLGVYVIAQCSRKCGAQWENMTLKQKKNKRWQQPNPSREKVIVPSTLTKCWHQL